MNGQLMNLKCAFNTETQSYTEIILSYLLSSVAFLRVSASLC